MSTKNWYVVHTYAGFENKVKANILETVSKQGLQEKISQVLVPTEEVLSLKAGKKRKSQRKFFPGYILVEMEMDDNTWHVVKDTPKVTGFVGGSLNPTPGRLRVMVSIFGRSTPVELEFLQVEREKEK